jgi:hypothetical protein
VRADRVPGPFRPIVDAARAALDGVVAHVVERFEATIGLWGDG